MQRLCAWLDADRREVQALRDPDPSEAGVEAETVATPGMVGQYEDLVAKQERDGLVARLGPPAVVLQALHHRVPSGNLRRARWRPRSVWRAPPVVIRSRS